MIPKILRQSTVAALILALAHGSASADGPVELTNTQMDTITAGALVGVQQQGKYLVFYDNQLSYPAAKFDTTLPTVQQVLTWFQAGLLPPDLNTAYSFLAQADPQGTRRAIPGIGGCNTSMGPGIPGFTVGC